MTVADRLLCGTTARWLAAVARCAGALGLGAAALAALALLMLPAPRVITTMGFLAVLLISLAERLLALRLVFDAGLFADLADRDAHGDAPVTFASLDAALQALGLRRAPAATRGLLERIAGARRLSLQHLAVVLAQVALLAAALLAQQMGSRP
ncbi:MAG: hypothetical protein QM722_05070 [Piscinibacter sp.]